MSRIALDAFLNYRFLSDAALSPDGRQAAFLSHRINTISNGYDTELWTADTKHGGTVRLTDRADFRDLNWVDGEQ